VSPPVVCLTTVATKRQAEKIARGLLEKRLVACINIIPGALSFYHWNKKLCRDSELILILKTTRSKVSALEKELHRLHPYELPEWIVLPTTGGSRRYLKWLRSEVS
jgi:periplasmic divalent cation tolerance protein